ncbi:MAG: hypothetical protein JRI39_00450 [Deltaproteobacteria bacterium]|nr:hypothetical protein [Deltaproteobacteria bacterium]
MEQTVTLEWVSALARRVAAGETVPKEDLRKAIAFLREDRISAGDSGKAKKAPKQPPNIEELLNGF